jgi:hypothetical protein
MSEPEDKTARASLASEAPEQGSLSNSFVALVFAGIAVALVLGYLFVNKLIDMGQQEDCALAHRYNCNESSSAP